MQISRIVYVHQMWSTFKPSGARTNLIVGGTRPKLWKFFSSCSELHHFFGLQVELDVLVSPIVVVSTVWSVSCLLFFYWRCESTLTPLGTGARAQIQWSQHHCISCYGVVSRVGHGSIFQTKSNPIYKYLVLNRTRKPCATATVCQSNSDFNRGKTGIVKSSEIIV